MRLFINIGTTALVALMMLASCKKDNPESENPGNDNQPDTPVVLDNAIEYKGEITDIRSTLIDPSAEIIYLVAQENVTSEDQLADGNYEYVRIEMVGDLESDNLSHELDLKASDIEYDIQYVKNGNTLVSVSSTDNSAITEGEFIMTINPDELIMEVNFSMQLAEGGSFRGNVDINLDYEEPGPVYPENDMTFVVDGEESQVGSAVVENYEDYIMFTLSPESGYESFNDIYDAGVDYIQVLMLPGVLNADMEIFSGDAIIYGMKDGEALEIHRSTGLDLLDAGYVRIDDNGEDSYSLYMTLSFVGGPEVGARATAVMAEPVPENLNTITVNGETQPVRIGFYMDGGGGLMYLYFTSADITYFDEIYDAYDYFGVVLYQSEMTGKEIDITNYSQFYYVLYMNNVTGDMLMSVSGNLNGATGTLSLVHDAADPEYYEVEASVVFGDGTTVEMSYKGNCVSSDYVPEEPNEFTYNGVTEAIQSVLVDKTGGDVWEIWVSATPGLDTVEGFESDGCIHITAPSEAFNTGYGVGFSTYQDVLKFEFGDDVWQYPDTGTLEVTLDGTDMVLDFTTYGDLVGHYSGTVTVVE